MMGNTNTREKKVFQSLYYVIVITVKNLDMELSNNIFFFHFQMIQIFESIKVSKIFLLCSRSALRLCTVVKLFSFRGKLWSVSLKSFL